MINYTASDCVGCLRAILFFLPFLLVPGYVVGWLTDCFEFRRLSSRWRILSSLPLSIALCPIIAYWLGSFFSFYGVWSFYGLLFAAWVFLLLGFGGHERLSKSTFLIPKSSLPYVFVAIGWALLVVLSHADLQIGNRLYFSFTAYDYSVRTAITEAITRTGVQPKNPFYLLDGAAPLRYHYFWFIACSLVQQVGGQLVNARQATVGSAVWCGWALMALVPMSFRFFIGGDSAMIKKRGFLAITFFGVTGLDILPTIWLWLHGQAYPDMEWWNDQVTSWVGSALWVPHHVSTLVSGLTIILIAWHARSEPSATKRVVFSLLIGIASATMVGSSIYVALVFAAFLLLWTLLSLLTKDTRLFGVLLVAGLCAIALAVPYLRNLAGPADGGSLVKFTVRHFYPTDPWIHSHHPKGIVIAAIRLAALPLNYFMEFGFFFVVGFFYLRRRSFQASDLVLYLLAGTSVLVCTFMESGVLINNDLGWRGFLPAQFVLLLWAGQLFVGSGTAQIYQTPRLRSALWVTLLILGVTGTVYEVGMLRFFGLASDSGILPPKWAPDRHLGERTYSLRRLYDQLQAKTSAHAVIQNNPEWKYDDFFYGLYADRQTACYDPACGAEFGGDPKVYAKLYPKILSIFAANSLSFEQVVNLCRELKIKAIVLKDLDPAWKDPNSWANRTPPSFGNEYSRVYLLNY